MIMDEGNCYVSHEDVCTKCGDYLLEGEHPLLIVIESGTLAPMKKDPAFLKFIPDRANIERGEEDTYVDAYHASCLMEGVQSSWGRYSPARCDACGDRFLADLPGDAYHLLLGQVHFDTGIFLADDDPSNGAILCPYCFDFHVGGE